LTRQSISLARHARRRQHHRGTGAAPAPCVHRLVRNGFLAVVLVWLGWTAGVQLSIVNVMNYVMAPFSHFDIGFYLAEPLVVIVALLSSCTEFTGLGLTSAP